ncbi:MAG: EAL domain-containing protein, partial [Rhodobacterales bacterium]|nr:EAL domain-containing protein [Rhodobacterales bacterium]
LFATGLGVGGLVATGFVPPDGAGPLAATWFIAVAVGVLSLAPALVLAQQDGGWPHGRHRARALALWEVLIGLAGLVLWLRMPIVLGVGVPVVMVLAVWSALRLPPAVTFTGLAVLAGTLVSGTVLAMLDQPRLVRAEALVLLQAVLAVGLLGALMATPFGTFGARASALAAAPDTVSLLTRRLRWYPVLLALLIIGVTGIGIIVLYRTALEEQQAHLADRAQTVADLGGSVAAFNQRHGTAYPGGWRAATLAQIAGALGPLQGDVEMTVAERSGDWIRFLLVQRGPEGRVPVPDLPLGSPLAAPMNAALQGRSGSMTSQDYRGRMVIAAFRPIAGMDMGLVVKKDLQAVRRPFLHAGFALALTTLAFVFLSALGATRLARPAIDALIAGERRYRVLVESHGDLICRNTPDGTLLFANTAYCRHFGIDPDAVEGTSLLRFVPEPFRQKTLDHFRSFTPDRPKRVQEHAVTLPDGTESWMEWTNTAIFDDDGKAVEFVGIGRDTTERRLTEQQLRLQAAAMDAAANAFFITNRKGQFEWVNAAFTTLSGYTLEEVVGHTPRILNSGLHGADFYDHMWTTILDGQAWKGIITNRCKDGRRYVVEQTITPITDDRGRLTHFVAVQEDISQHIAARDRMHHMATHDILTNLPNRLLFAEHLMTAHRSLKRDGRPFAVHYLDLDHFKTVNDTYGHSVGDDLLVAVARRLTNLVRETDTVARFGGDEFAVLQTGLAHPRDAAELAQRIIEALARPFELGNTMVHTGTSVGIAVCDSDATDAEDLVEYADLALFQSKADGRGRLTFHESAMSEVLQARVALARDLAVAVRTDSLHLAFQPVVDVRTGRVTGLEALCRWTHPDLGEIPPEEFVALAEEMGHILPLGERVLSMACRQGVIWLVSGLLPDRLSVNVSAIQLNTPSFAGTVADILEDTGFPADRLEMELAENVFMERSAVYMESMRTLAAMGVRFAIDDFGVGYSSITYLKELPVNAVKIAQVFIPDMDSDATDQAIVEAIVHMARSLGLRCVAEGVETASQLTLLAGLDCDEVQGFHVCPPQPAAEVKAFLQAERHPATAGTATLMHG